MSPHVQTSEFIWQAVTVRPLTVWRTALDQKRPYLDLGDAVRALCFIIERDHFTNELYNVVTVNATVGDIIDFIRGFVPDLKVSFVESQIMNQLSYHVSSAKFQALGFTAGGRLQQGIKDTLAHLAGLTRRRIS